MRLAFRVALSLAIFVLIASAGVEATPSLMVSPNTIPRDRTLPVQIDIGSLTGGAAVLRLYTDANGNGAIDAPDDTMIWADLIEDNGGEWSPNMFVDSNVAVGAITVDVERFTPLGRYPYTTGNYIWEAEDTGDMSTQLGSFSITQTALAQSVSGRVRDGVSMLGVPGAVVLSFPFCDQEGGDQAIFSTISDQSGDYTIELPATVECRDRIVLPVKPGYLSPFAGQPQGYYDGSTQLINQDPTLNPANRVSTGQVKYATGTRTGQGIPGLIVLADVADGLPSIAVGFTDENGDYTLTLNDGDWQVGNPEDGLDTRGVVYVDGGHDLNVAGSGVMIPDLFLPAANAFFEGTVRDASMSTVGAHLIEGYEIGSCDPNCHESFTYTRADGSYTLGVVAPAGPATAEYDFGVAEPLPGLIGERLSCEFISATQTLTGKDLDYQMPTSFISGNVFDSDGADVSGTCLQARAFQGCTSYVSVASSDCDGSFKLPVIDGSWSVETDTGEFGTLYAGFEESQSGNQVDVMNSEDEELEIVLERWRLAPFIRGFQPAEPIAGQHLVLFGYGFSLGSDPQVFFDAIPATLVAFRPDKGAMVVEVPPMITPGSYQVTVVNTDLGMTSDPACVEVGVGSYPSVCTISGTVTDAGGAAENVLVVAEFNDDFERVALTDVNGDYTLNLGAAGSYRIEFEPPAGVRQLASPAFDVTCGNTQDHLLVDGFLLTGELVGSNFNPLADAPIEAEEVGGSFFDADTNSDTDGRFSFAVPAGTFNLFLGTPPNSRQLPPASQQVVVAGDTDVGQIYYTPGVMLVGRVVDDSGAGRFTEVAVFDRAGGIFSGSTLSDSCTGAFSIGLLPVEYGLTLQSISGPSLQPTRVEWFEMEGDDVSRFDFVMSGPELTQPITVSSPPQVQLIEPGFQAQQGQVLLLSATRLNGSSVKVQFTNVGGTFIDGDAPVVDASRGLIFVRVPANAASGGLRVQVDGINSEVAPFELLPGLYSPGSFTASGTISGLGGVPTIVAIDSVDPSADCETDDLISDYTMTDAMGNYGPLSHPGGDINLIVVPQQSSGLAGKVESVSSVMSNVTIDTTVSAGVAVSIRLLDEMMNPVEDARFWSDSDSVGVGDETLTDSNGNATLYLAPADYELGAIPPVGSRLLEIEDQQMIAAPFDYGDQQLPTGSLVSSAVFVEPEGTPLAGAEIEAQGRVDPFDFYHETFSGVDGSFSGPVEFGSSFSLRGDSKNSSLTDFRRNEFATVGFDTILYPEFEVGVAGLISGTVTDETLLQPIGNIFVVAYDENPQMPGQINGFVDAGVTCDDGSYRVKLPPANYFIQILDFDQANYVSEWYDDSLCFGGASLEFVAPGFTNTVDAELELGGVVTGVVTNGGVPLAGVTVCANSSILGGCATRCVTTDALGGYRLVLSPASDYVIESISPTFGSQCYQGDFGCVAPDLLDVVAGVTNSNIDFSYGCTGADLDGDGVSSCGGDCDDGDPNNYPGNAEICDGQDNNCDTLVDDADGLVTGQPLWYEDADLDGAGDPNSNLFSCVMPFGFVANDSDCDPANGNVYPGAPEINDGLDNQCDGEVGFGAVDELSGQSGFANGADKDQFSWQAQAGATAYRAVRSTSADFSDASTLFETAGTVWDDVTQPASGETFFYLARAAAPMNGGWGLRSDGTQRRVDVLVNGDVERWQSANNLETWVETTASGSFEQEMDPAQVVSGQIAARITRTSSGVLSLNYIGVPVDPGVDYTLKLSAKFSQAESNAVQIRIFNFTTGEDLQTDGSWAIGGASYNFALTTNYQELSVPFTVDPTFAPTDQIRMIIRHRFSTPIGSILWLDDIRIEE